MKNWSKRHTLIGGVALIALTNAVALLGIAYNRSGEPESVLTLTQRELQPPYAWMTLNRENSGMSLRIHWRYPSKDGYSCCYTGGSPEWLDEAKMASLGFDVSSPQGTRDRDRRAARQHSREVLLVLEMDGPAYQQTLERARRQVAEQDAKLAATPDDVPAQASAKMAREALAREERDNTRLFAVDAGLDQAALRAKFPDRSRYAIVNAQVHLVGGSEHGKFSGYVEKLSVDEINVPHDDRAFFERGAPQAPGKAAFPVLPVFGERGATPFQARVAFGQRLEPWLAGISNPPQ